MEPSRGASASASGLDDASLESKEGSLLSRLAGLGSVAVAFSGGVDSSYLCDAAYRALGDRAQAICSDSPLLPRRELARARELAAGIGIRLVVLEDSIPEAAIANGPDRCYGCKRAKLEAILAEAARLGLARVVEGSNADDDGDYRPGARAVRELGVLSPLREAGLSKAEIRELSRRRGLATWDKPASACLASRVPYGQRLEPGTLARIEAAEDYLEGLGFMQFRVRSLGDAARIELARDERRRLFDEALLDEVSRRLKALGFLYVCLELEGYAMGSLNRAIDTKGTEP